MTDLQTSYREIVVALNSPGDKRKKKPSFEEAILGEDNRLPGAAVAVALSVLEDGEIKLQHLAKQIPDFTQTEIRLALSRLQKNSYFTQKGKKYLLNVGKDEDINGTLFWALMGAVANGWIERQ